MDTTVRLDCIEHGGRSRCFRCHTDRVKAIETDFTNDSLFWSASEDGSCRQFDARVSMGDTRDCMRSSECDCRNDIISHVEKRGVQRHEGPNVFFADHIRLSIKTFTLNRVHTQYFAIGGDDSFLRVYDRRLCQVGRGRRNAVRALVGLYAPSHLHHCAYTHITHARFDPSGRQLLASYNLDHLYTFDVFGNDAPQVAAAADEAARADWCATHAVKEATVNALAAKVEYNRMANAAAIAEADAALEDTPAADLAARVADRKMRKLRRQHRATPPLSVTTRWEQNAHTVCRLLLSSTSPSPHDDLLPSEEWPSNPRHSIYYPRIGDTVLVHKFVELQLAHDALVFMWNDPAADAGANDTPHSLFSVIPPREPPPHLSPESLLIRVGLRLPQIPPATTADGGDASGVELLCATAVAEKECGNAHFRAKEYGGAIAAYTRALLVAEKRCTDGTAITQPSTSPSASLDHCGTLYANRALSLLRRKGAGDARAALDDALAAFVFTRRRARSGGSDGGAKALRIAHQALTQLDQQRRARRVFNIQVYVAVLVACNRVPLPAEITAPITASAASLYSLPHKTFSQVMHWLQLVQGEFVATTGAHLQLSQFSSPMPSLTHVEAAQRRSERTCFALGGFASLWTKKIKDVESETSDDDIDDDHGLSSDDGDDSDSGDDNDGAGDDSDGAGDDSDGAGDDSEGAGDDSDGARSPSHNKSISEDDDSSDGGCNDHNRVVDYVANMDYSSDNDDDATYSLAADAPCLFGDMSAARLARLRRVAPAPRTERDDKSDSAAHEHGDVAADDEDGGDGVKDASANAAGCTLDAKASAIALYGKLFDNYVARYPLTLTGLRVRSHAQRFVGHRSCLTDVSAARRLRAQNALYPFNFVCCCWESRYRVLPLCVIISWRPSLSTQPPLHIHRRSKRRSSLARILSSAAATTAVCTCGGAATASCCTYAVYAMIFSTASVCTQRSRCS